MRKLLLALIIVIVAATFGCFIDAPPASSGVTDVSARRAGTLVNDNRDNPDFIILDIRTPGEYAQGHIARAVLLDFTDPAFRAGLKRLDRSKTYLFYCRSGNRSGRAMQMIDAMGFRQVYHLKTGIIGWHRERLPIVRP